jgi:hypothetical protein
MVGSSKTAVEIETTMRYIPEDGSIHKYSSENLRSYIDSMVVSPWLG